MKIEGFILGVLLCVCCVSTTFVGRPKNHKPHLLGEKKCTWGPSYWCQNLTAAGDCHAVKHCIQNVWIHKQLPEDSSSVCQTCLDMVKQARDQLESNETQELIKEVFEGTCALIHIKPIVKECDKIADNYIPELIDTLASQMNPQIVCSVAGLCNNPKIQEAMKQQQQEVATTKSLDSCDGCKSTVNLLKDKFEHTSRDDFRNSLLMFCRGMGTFSDACTNLILTYEDEIYSHIKENLIPEDVCILSGDCYLHFHQHKNKNMSPNVEITPLSKNGYIDVNSKDDLPCDLCEQLVKHLKDVLITNTTEDEFKVVLEGLCNQTNRFQKECLSIVDEYYGVAYNFLMNELNSSAVCIMVGICPGLKSESYLIAPLLPVKTVEKIESKKMTNQDVSLVEHQLPIDLLVPPHTQLIYNQQLCVFCEYFLHYVQQVITSPKSEEEIREVIDKACSKLPSSVNETCVQFVNMYEPALVAILAQEIDPSEICPLIKACPAKDEEKNIDIFMTQRSDGSKCPLCLFAVSKLEEMVKNKKTEENIRNALSHLCSHLSDNLAEECNDFVNTYTDELVEMLIADLNPQEVCVYLNLCTDNSPPKSHFTIGDTESNNIFDNTVDGKLVSKNKVEDNGACVICEFVMRAIQDELKDNKTDENIKNTVHKICNILPKTVKDECNGFVDQYADTIIRLLVANTSPQEVCSLMSLCPNKLNQIEEAIGECALCEVIVSAMKKIIANPSADHAIKHVLEKACRAVGESHQQKCIELVDKYGQEIFEMLTESVPAERICHYFELCQIRSADVKFMKKFQDN